MKKDHVAELQKKLAGEVFDAPDALDYFSTDGSVFAIRPTAVVYPNNEADVCKTVRYVSQAVADGDKLSVIGRGKGTDQGGGALGDGIMLVFPAHMNRLRRLDRTSVTIQPGLLYRDLQNTLHTHGRFLPPYPSSIDFSTLGGAVANNACGEKTVKYGATRDYVKNLRVVLADGSVIETGRLTKRQLERKKRQTDLEGEIYRRVDELLLNNAGIIKRAEPSVTKNAAGYALWDVRGKGGSFDLGQLIIGSQGTLGLVTEITLHTVPYNPRTTLVVGYFDSIEAAGQAVTKIQSLGPSALEIVDYYLLDFLKQNKPEQIAGLVPDPLPKVVLLAEFDDMSQVRQTYKAVRVRSIYGKYAASHRVSTKPHEQEELWKIRRSAAAVIWMTKGSDKALPIIEDGVVPVDKLPEFLDKAYKLLKKHDLQIAVWGHAGNANFHMQPFMDLGKKKDRDKLFKVVEEFYDMVIKMGGSTCGEHNDGLVRAPYLEKLYGKKMVQLFREVKDIFDPQGILNPNKKMDVTVEYTKGLLREEYSMKHLYDHMPHT